MRAGLAARLYLVLAALLAAAVSAACGDSFHPAAPTRAQGANLTRLTGAVAPGACARPIPGITPADCVERVDYTAARDGALTATLTWTGTSDMDLVVTPVSCGTYDQYGCAIRAESRQLPEFERVMLPVARGEALRFWIHNNSAAPTDYTLELSLE